jgi:hypothetical protein
VFNGFTAYLHQQKGVSFLANPFSLSGLEIKDMLKCFGNHITLRRDFS